MEGSSFKLKLHPKQQEAFAYLRTRGVHTVLFGGGLSGGKSTLIGAWILWSALTYPNTRYLIGRKVLRDLLDTTLVSLWRVADDMGIRSSLTYNQQSHTITLPNGSVILLRNLDVTPSDPTMVGLGSLELTGAAIDELGDVDEVAYTTLLQRLRYNLPPHGGKVLMASNPTKDWPYRRIYLPWEQGQLNPGVRYVPCLPKDNPFNLLIPGYIESLTPENLGVEAYNSRVLGDWHYTVGDSDLYVETDILNAANWDTIGIDQREKVLSIDVATKQGSDATVAMLFTGRVLVRVWEWRGRDTVELYNLIRTIIADNAIPIRNVVIDAIGVGQGLHDMLRGSMAFKSNAIRLNDEGYQTLRDQVYFKAAELFAKGELRLRVDREVISQLTKELTAHKRYNVQGASLARVTPKDQVSRSIGKSPDYADAFVMAMMLIAYRKRELRVEVVRW